MDASIGRRYALCIGIGQYTELVNHDLRYAVSDAQSIADILKDTQRGNFEVTLITEPIQTTKQALDEYLDQTLNASNLNPEDMVLIYISCHGSTYGRGNTFYLLPSNTNLEDDFPKKTTIIDIHDLAKTLSDAKVKNIIFLLDACYSGGAGYALKLLNFDLNLSPDTNVFIIGAARHDQATFQSSNLKHGIFTHCLLKAFEQKPRRSDGWLTISEIRSFLTEEINSHATENSLQFQEMSASVNSNLLVVKNPRYSARNLEFYEQVKKLLRFMKYEPADIEEFKDAPPGFYIAEINAGMEPLRAGIIPYYNQVEVLTPKEAEKLAIYVKEQIKLGNLDQGILVTMLTISNEVKQILSSHGGRSLVVKTYDGIWKNLIDFKKYLQELIYSYEHQVKEDKEIPLAHVYIPLKAERRSYDFEYYQFATKEIPTTQKFKTSFHTTWKGDLEETVKQWLSNPTDSRLALLADYGSGKTTFCQHMAAFLSKNFLEGKDNGSYENRIPLLIPLLEFAKAPFDLEIYLMTYLQRHCKVDHPNFNTLMKMAEAGLFLFMLDGFDEMASRANNDTVQQNMALFEQLANVPKNKVLLTTRPEYFMNLSQEMKVLRAYDRLYLQPFSKEQTDLYLQKRVSIAKDSLGDITRDWMYYRQMIDNIHDLSDLSCRPVLLEMIIKTLPTLITEQTVVDRPNLYQHYLEGEIERQLLKQRRDLQIDRQKRFAIMEQVALELYLTDKIELTSDQIREVSKKLLTSEQLGEMEGSLREFLTCSFLIRLGDEYRFSHQSFIEYLVACRLAKDIMSDNKEIFRKKPISFAIRDFLQEQGTFIEQRQQKFSDTTNTSPRFDYRKLEAWFRNDPKDKWTSSNSISILGKLLPNNQLCSLPLRMADLSGADLSQINLSGADLSEANLSGADLSQAKLDRANLRGADLSQTNLSKTDLSQANLNGAVLRGADLSQANLSGADLNQANLQYANLKHANLSYTILEYANLSYANLRYANLYRATLQDADLTGTDFFSADLSSADLRNTDLSHLNLRMASLSGATLNNANLNRVDLSGSYLNGADLGSTDLNRSDLSRANLTDANLSEADLSEANLVNADLRGADLHGADLSGANLSNANLSEADLSGIALCGIDLREIDLSKIILRGLELMGVNLIKVDLKERDLSEANLSEANLSQADLSEANLSKANLDSADLSSANLSNANLTSANLDGADLRHANLRNANLSRASLYQADLKHADLTDAILIWVDLSKVYLEGTILTGSNLNHANLTNVDLSQVDLSQAYLGDIDFELFLSEYRNKNYIEEIADIISEEDFDELDKVSPNDLHNKPF
jgi:uncharacterized protein YjbI with pentapeptide repeats